MSYIDDKKNRFREIIGNLYYYGGLGYVDIYVIALLYFKNSLDSNEIFYKDISKLVHDRINELIDLD